MQFRNNKIQKSLSYSIILAGILFGSNIYAQHFNETIIGNKTEGGNVISIRENDKFIMNSEEHTHSGAYDTVAGGLSEGNGNIKNNSITIDNNQTVYNLYGGKSNSGTVSNNQILIQKGGVIMTGAYGGYSSQGSVFNNTLTLKNTVFTSSAKIRAGYSDSGKVYNNKLILDNVAPLTTVYSGFSGTGEVKNNSIDIKNGTYLEERAYGGYSSSGVVDSNSITVNDTSRARFLYGGYSANGTAKGNTVIFKAEIQTNGLPLENTKSSVNLNSENGISLTMLLDETPPEVDRGTPVDPSLNDQGWSEALPLEDDYKDFVRNAEIAMGGASDISLVTLNTIDFQSGIADTLMGGSSTSGQVSKNSVFLKGGYSVGTVYGGFSASGAVDNNIVEILDGFTSKGLLIGGESSQGSVTGNQVVVNGGTVYSDIIGGKNFSNATNSNNAVFVKNGSVKKDIYGGYNPSNGDIHDNYVEISGGEIAGKIYGGYNGETFEEHPQDKGAYSNTVKITGGSVTGEIYGGYSLNESSASNNTVEIHSGTYTQNIYGGYSKNGQALNNSVILSGGTITGNVYASAGKNNISGKIIIKDNANVENANLYGGLIIQENTDENTRILNTQLIQSTLEFDGFTGTIKTINDFKTINFKNIIWQQNNKPVVTIADATNSKINGTKVNIEKITIPTEVEIKLNDSLTIFNQDVSNGIEFQNQNIQTYKGTTLLGSTTLNNNNGTINAQIIALGLNPQTTLVAENRAVASAFINQGNDLISDKLDTLSYMPNSGFSMFASTYGNASEYDTRTNFKINGFTSSFGLGYTKAFDTYNLSFLAFYENSTGNYRTYNHFDNEAFTGYGKISTNGGGVATRFDFENGFYTEASLRVGTLQTSMQNALKDAQGKFYGYDLNSAYYGAHLGFGKRFQTSEKFEFDVYSKFFYTYTDKDSFRIENENFKLDSVQSTRARLGVKSNANLNDKIKAYAGLAYEYEFDGVANMQISEYKLAEQSLKGSSYAGELGLNYQVNKGLNLDLKTRGFLGKREGVSGTLSLNYKF